MVHGFPALCGEVEHGEAPIPVVTSTSEQYMFSSRMQNNPCTVARSSLRSSQTCATFVSARDPDYTQRRKETHMLWTIFVILLVLWLFGLVSSYTLGGFIHLLLVIAVIVLVVQLMQGRRPPV
jgi:heme A synthase